MSGQRARNGRHSDAERTGRHVAIAAALAVFALCALTVLAGPALAEDTDPPTFGNGTAVNDTTFEVVVEDDAGVDEGSITASDLSLSSGSIDSINVIASGDDSVVSVRIGQPLRDNNITVSVAGAISDDAGNELTDGSVTVTGMDAFEPYLKEYEVNRLSDDRVEIVFYTDERIGNASVAVAGPESEALGPEAFTETDTPPANEYQYATNYTFDAEGEYTITLEWIADHNENFGLYYADRSVVYDVSRPQARIKGPASGSLGQNLTFDATESTDDRSVVSYEWAVDGNQTGTNETTTYVFEETGRHEISLTVADGRNNTDTAVTTVEILDVTTSRDVTISDTNGTGVDVTIGPNRTKDRVLVQRSRSLASNGSVSLDSLTLSVPTNATTNLTTAAAADTPADFNETDQVGFGTFDVSHEGADVSDVTFRFTVARSAIENASVSPDRISLFRDHGGWTRLTALRVDGNATHLQYRATSPGLSGFVVAGTNASVDEGSSDGDDTGGKNEAEGDTEESSNVTRVVTGEPSFAVADGTLLTRSVSAGDHVVAQVTIVNDGNATGTYVAGLVVNGSVVTTTAVTIPAGERRDVTLAQTVEHSGTVTVNGTRLGTLTVGDGAAVSDGEGDGGGGIPIPNPLALWPGGLVGRVLGAIFWLGVVTFGILKGLAIYLGY